MSFYGAYATESGRDVATESGHESSLYRSTSAFDRVVPAPAADVPASPPANEGSVYSDHVLPSSFDTKSAAQPRDLGHSLYDSAISLLHDVAIADSASSLLRAPSGLMALSSGGGGSGPVSRDWTRDFERVLAMPLQSVEEEAARATALRALVDEFSAAVTRIGRTIIEQVHLADDDTAKTYKPTANVGGIAGGAKFVAEVCLFTCGGRSRMIGRGSCSSSRSIHTACLVATNTPRKQPASAQTCSVTELILRSFAANCATCRLYCRCLFLLFTFR